MVHPQYNPQEALERVKLMMKYDTSKTLNENKSVIFEQVDCPNSISDDEMEEICNEMWNNLQKLKGWIVRNLIDRKEIVKNIYNTINDLINKNYKDDLTGQCEPAIKSFKEFYKQRAKEGGWFGFSTDGSFENELKNLKKDEFITSQGNKLTKYIDAAIKILQTEKSINYGVQSSPQSTTTTTPASTSSGWEKYPCVPRLATKKGVKIDSMGAYVIGNVRYFANGRKGNISTKEMSNYTCEDPEFSNKKNRELTFTACTGRYSPNCKTDPSGAIGQVQACLGGLVVDGKYGPKTTAKLKDIGYNSFTDADVAKICNKQTSTPEPEVGGEEVIVDPNADF